MVGKCEVNRHQAAATPHIPTPASLTVFQRCLNQPQEQRMGLIGAALELRVILHTDIKIVPFDFHRLHNVVIGGSAADGQTGRFQFRPERLLNS